MYAITTENLSKSYSARKVLEDVSIHVDEGEIYALVGANGAGKTTLLRAIAGLINYEGTLTIFGESDPKKLSALRECIGALIETAPLSPDLDALENMKLAALPLGISDVDALKGLITLVGLDPEEHKKVKAFSLGMKQRLGIATALIGDPKILLLDEPVNGLDPQGIIEIRELLLQLKERGRTIIISSHLLTELKKLATSYGILKKGRLIRELKEDELNALMRPAIKLVVADIELAREIAGSALSEEEYEILPRSQVAVYNMQRSMAELQELFAPAGIMSSSLDNGDVESVFMHIMGGENER